MAAVAVPSFCAVCLSPRGPFAREPIGIDDAIVNVCATCREQEVVPKDENAGRRGLVSRNASGEDLSGMSRAERVKYMRRIGKWKR